MISVRWLPDAKHNAFAKPFSNVAGSKESVVDPCPNAVLSVPPVFGVEASTPKTGGTLRTALGHGSTTDSFDPATFENGFANALCFASGNHLTEINNEGQLQPELAESYESDDAITWRFNIRKGVEFHNGKTLTPEDVVASINHHRGEESTSGAKGLLEASKRPLAPDVLSSPL